MIYSIHVPADNERGAQYMEQVLDALHARTRWFQSFSLEFGRHDGEVMLFCRVPASLRRSLERQIHASYPDCMIEPVGDPSITGRSRKRTRHVFLKLKPLLGNIRNWTEFTDREQRTFADPVAGILNLIADDAVDSRVIFTARPIPARLIRIVHRWKASSDGHSKFNGNSFVTRLTILTSSQRDSKDAVVDKSHDLASAFSRFVTGPVSFIRSRLLPWFVTTSTELATMWHPPTSIVRSQKLSAVGSRQLEPPANLTSKENDPAISVLGRVAFHHRSDVFGISPADRRRHLAVVGKTGMGKSTLLLNLILSDIVAGRGAGLIDPHGDLAEDIAASIPSERTNDVLYFDAGDRQHPIGFNPLAVSSDAERPLVVSGVVATFKKLHGDSWGPRLEHILRNALLALIENRGTSLVSLVRFLADRAYQKQLVGRLTDPVVRSFWQDEFARWKPQLQAEAVSPVQNKVGQFVSNPVLRSIFGQDRDRLQLRKLMNSGRVLIVNLSKGRIGEDASTMLGSLLVTQLQLAAMSRAAMPESQRREFYAYVDEFQNFATESFATILSEARKYRLALTLANQYLDQMDETTLSAVFGNVGSMLAFQVGAQDANVLTEQFGGDLTPADLMALPKYTAYARLLIDGMPSRPFSMRTIPPEESAARSRLQVIRKTSRHRFGRPASEVERAIATSFGKGGLQL